jgi:hypothetical protein
MTFQVESVAHMTEVSKVMANRLHWNLFYKKAHLWAWMVLLFLVDAYLFIRMCYHHGRLYL